MIEANSQIDDVLFYMLVVFLLYACILPFMKHNKTFSMALLPFSFPFLKKV